MRWIRARWTRWFCLCVCLAMSSVGLLLAQTDDDNTRIISATITDSTQLTVQIAVSPNKTIDSVTVDLPDDMLTLTQTDITFTEERWLLLNGGRDMLNAESEIRDELGALLADDDLASRTGLIIFQGDSDSVVIEPSSNVEIVRDAVATYQASASNVGCVANALTAFNRYHDATPDATIVRRVLLITGSTSCEEQLPTIAVPVDVLVLGRANSQLITLADQSDTVIRTSNLLVFDRVLAEVLSRWQTDILNFETRLSEDIASAVVTITDTDGQTVSRTVPVTGTFSIASTPTPMPSPTMTPTPIAISASSEDDTATSDDIDEAGAVISDESDDEEDTLPASAKPLMETDDLLQLLVIFLFATVMIGSAYVARRMRRRRMVETLNEEVNVHLDGTRQIALAYLRDSKKTNVYPVYMPASILGRGGESTLIIKDDLLSREHVRFTETDKHGLLMTRLSQAEVLVNGEPVERAQQLFVGDEITLSPNTSLLVERIDDDI